MIIVVLLFQILFIPLFSPLLIGVIRRIKARMQNRQGASIIQPYYDLWKLFQKDEVISKDASWIFRFAPYVIFAISIILPLGIPVISTISLFSFMGDFLVIIYLVALMTFILALAGIDVGSAFGGFGSSREMTITAITEGAFVFSILPVVIFTSSSNISSIIVLFQSNSINGLLPLSLAFVTFLTVLLAESKRFPFDNPATHLELTMIHEAMILEYSGKRLALVEWASANKTLFFIVLGMNLYFPWSLSSNTDPILLFYSFLMLLIKILVVAMFVGLIESSIAKFRFFRLPDILLTAYILGVIALIMVAL
ncbi:MAG: NADH-quinone oxidoreductase subunit H [Candidatus Roizmanbacteria bacterium]